jgi:epoxyqueuosine reductase
MVSSSTFGRQIKAHAHQLGFDTVGIVSVPPPSSHTVSFSDLTTDESNSLSITVRLWKRLTDWLDQGFHGTMTWMERDPQRRSDPTKVLPGCQSMIVVGMNYYTEHFPDEKHQAGRIARYAWGKDYHEVLKDRLKQLEEYLHNQNYGESLGTRSRDWLDRQTHQFGIDQLWVVAVAGRDSHDGAT